MWHRSHNRKRSSSALSEGNHLKFRHAAVACSAAIALAGAAWAVGQQAGPGAPAATAKPAAAPAPPAAKPASAATPQAGGVAGRPGKPQKAPEKPLWRDLTPAQQAALEPLGTEWDQLEGVRKQKWLEMANRFASMKPEEQQRVHERMREWIRLTPAQRKLARDTYTRTKKLAPGEKTATWESYQQLPEEQKQKLAATAAARKQGAAPPTAHPGAVLRKGATACPAGTVKNEMSATPPCVPGPSAPAAAAPTAAAPAASPAATTPAPGIAAPPAPVAQPASTTTTAPAPNAQ